MIPPTKDKQRTRWMRLVLLFICIFSIVASFLLVRVQPPRAVQSVQVLTSDWEPYVNPVEENGGTVGEIVVSVLASSGYAAQVTEDNWDSGLEKVDAGTAFGIFPMVKSDERLDKFEYSEPLVDFRYVLFKRSNDPVSSEVLAGDLSQVRVGRIDGYDYWPQLDASGADFRDFPSTSAGFQALRDGEIDFLAESDVVGNATLTSAEFVGDASWFEIVESDNPALSSTDSVYFLVRKSDLSSAVMERFNQSLEQFKQSERYRELVSSLGGVPDDVILVGDGLVEVSGPAGEPLGAIPPGVRARVVAWPDELHPGSRLEVKMLDGPLAGRIATVDLEHVEVSGV